MELFSIKYTIGNRKIFNVRNLLLFIIFLLTFSVNAFGGSLRLTGKDVDVLCKAVGGCSDDTRKDWRIALNKIDNFSFLVSQSYIAMDENKLFNQPSYGYGFGNNSRNRALNMCRSKDYDSFSNCKIVIRNNVVVNEKMKNIILNLLNDDR